VLSSTFVASHSSAFGNSIQQFQPLQGCAIISFAFREFHSRLLLFSPFGALAQLASNARYLFKDLYKPSLQHLEISSVKNRFSVIGKEL